MMPFEIFISLGIFIATAIVATIWNRLFGRFIKRSTLIVKNDPTNYKFLRHAITAVIYVVGISWSIYRIQPLQNVANSLLAGAGILAVTVGFASQHALSNIVSGMFIVIFKPYRVNDRVTIKDTIQGVVEDITLRHTVIRDWQNRRIVIPNTIISDEVILNSDIIDQRINRWIEIGISYDSDIDKAREIIVEEVLSHPLHLDGRSPEQIAEGKELVPVKVVELGAYSIVLRAWVWARDFGDSAQMRWDLMESIKKRFDREGVEIPFPYRTLVYKNDLIQQAKEEGQAD